MRAAATVRGAGGAEPLGSEAVKALCARFPGEYWRRTDRERAYPKEFVNELTASGFLSALIPTEYGGQGLPLAAACAIMEEVGPRHWRAVGWNGCRVLLTPCLHVGRAGGRGAHARSNGPAATGAPATPKCTSWGRCCGTGTTSRSAGTCPPSLEASCAFKPLASRSRPVEPVRYQAPSYLKRRRRRRLTVGAPAPVSAAVGGRWSSETLALRTTAVRAADGTHYVVNGQKVWTSRAEHSDLMLLLARTAPRGEGAQRTDGLSVFLVDMEQAVAVRVAAAARNRRSR